MIAKSLILFILLIVLPDVFLYFRYLRKRPWWYTLLCFVPTFLLLLATVFLSRQPDFIPDNITWVNVYLFAIGLIPVAKWLFLLCSLCGRNGWKMGVVVVLLEWMALFYGSFIGSNQLEVKNVEIAFSDLPADFDGYRIVHFSDIHLGSSDKEFVKCLVDSVNAQQADIVVFTGDMQNKKPSEVEPYTDLLSAIKAKDGVFSVLGNHDYAEYIDAPYYVKAENEERIVGMQQSMGWTVLMNYYRWLHRGNDSIVISGMENDGEGRFPQKGNVNSALWGVSRSHFIVMLEHDPSSWQRKILTHSHTQLTLSGHTHGMQFEIFGWSPLSLLGRECDGLYERGHRYLYVSKGAGALVPFRLGCAPEIVVITLKRHQP